MAPIVNQPPFIANDLRDSPPPSPGQSRRLPLTLRTTPAPGSRSARLAASLRREPLAVKMPRPLKRAAHRVRGCQLPFVRRGGGGIVVPRVVGLRGGTWGRGVLCGGGGLRTWGVLPSRVAVPSGGSHLWPGGGGGGRGWLRLAWRRDGGTWRPSARGQRRKRRRGGQDAVHPGHRCRSDFSRSPSDAVICFCRWHPCRDRCESGGIDAWSSPDSDAPKTSGFARSAQIGA